MEQAKKDYLTNQMKHLYEESGEGPTWADESALMDKLIDAIARDLDKRYEFDTVLSMGSTGVICILADESLKVEVILKIPRPILRKKEEIARALAGEAELLVSLSHENLVKVHYRSEVKIDGDYYPFFVMEYVKEPNNLRNIFERQPRLSREQTLQLLEGVVSGLEYLHRKGVVHCDIKPTNILIGDDLIPKIADLGYSHKVSSSDKPTQIRATYLYLHPLLEDLLRKAVAEETMKSITDLAAVRIPIGANQVDARFDRYALGQSLLEVLTASGSMSQDEQAFTEYQKRYLSLIILRLMDGYFPEDLRKLPVTEFPANVLGEIAYEETSEVMKDFACLTSRYRVEKDVPELDLQLGTTVQLPGTKGVAFTERVRAVVEHPHFARLNHVNQLGLAYLVYPGATHRRFEHSLGTFANACRYLRSLYYDEANPLFRSIMRPADLVHALLAALLHDIGYYPLCHLVEEVGEERLSHNSLTVKMLTEDASVPLPENVDSLADVIRTEWQLGDEDFKGIVALLRPGSASSGLSFRQGILRSLLDSPIDCNKVDYLRRDSIHMELPYGKDPDLDRLVGCLTVAYDDQSHRAGLGVYEKGRISVEDIAFSRYAMYLSGYWHHTLRAIRSMVQYAVYRTLRGDATLALSLEEYVLGSVADYGQLTLPGLRSETIQPVSRISMPEGRVLWWLRERGDGAVSDLIDCLFAREVYKRLIEIRLNDNERIYTDLERLRDMPHGLDTVESFRESLEATLVSAAKEHMEPEEFQRLEAESQAPFILVDLPGREWRGQEVYCVSQRLDNVTPFSDVSPVWRTLHSEFNKCVVTFRVLVRRDARVAFRRLSRTELVDSLAGALTEVFRGRRR